MARRFRALLGAVPLAVGLALAQAPLAAHAVGNVYRVNSSADSHDLTPGNGTCADALGHCTLRAAIEEADAASAPATVFVHLADFSPAATSATIQLTLGQLAVTRSMTITGDGPTKVIIQASPLNRVFHVAASDVSGAVRIEGLTVSQGNLDLTSPGVNGGGIEHTGGTLTLDNVVISDNIASYGQGGGLWSNHPLTATNVVLSGNSASRRGGGAYIGDGGFASNQGVVWSLAHLTVKNNKVTGGNPADAGGGLRLEPGPGQTAELHDSTITANVAKHDGSGGGLAVKGYGTVKVDRVTITDNQAARGAGLLTDLQVAETGAVPSASFTDLIVTGNAATKDPSPRRRGCLAGDGAGVLDLGLGGHYLDVLVAGNTAAEDGGGFAFAKAGCFAIIGGHPQVTNATITGNSADTGGGIAVVGGKTVVDLAFATIEGNTARVAGFGGGIALQDYGLPVDHDKVNIKTSILANNHDTAALANCSQAAQVVSGGDNLEDGTTCGFTPAKHDHSSVDPKLGPLAANGGFSQTEALLTGSPAIDAVTAGNCTDGKTPAAPVTTDQRHLTRPGGTACDIGAFEVQPAAGGTQGVGTPTTGGPIAVPNTGGALSLTPALPLTAGGLLLLGLVRRRGQRH